MFLDLAVRFDPVRKCCDLVYDGRRLVLDRTPLTPMLISLGSERRAEPDDVLPDGSTGTAFDGGALECRRGAQVDALAGTGDRAGSRLWLLERAKLTDDTMQAAEDYAAEALSWIGDREGVEITAGASNPAPNMLLLAVRCGETQQQLRLRVSA